jgi:hypothetical protein
MSAMARLQDLIRRGEPGVDKAQQRLGEERVVIGGAMADLHRLPHRLGDAGPARVDQRAGRRARNEDPRQIEQQRRVLVAARIQAGQRHQHFAAADIRVADQVERRIGRDEAVPGERLQQMLRAAADDVFDSGEIRRAFRRRRRHRLGMPQDDRVQELGDRLADGGPVRVLVIARPDQGFAQALQTGRVAQLGKPGPAQQGPQRRIAKRGLVELAEMPVAAAVVQKHGVADVIERRAVLSGRQRTVGGPGDVLKFHGVSSCAILSHDPSGRPNRSPMGAIRLFERMQLIETV